MTGLDDHRREVEALRERISRLSAAVQHVSASLDLDTVLDEILENARALTGARYGVITTIGEAGQPVDFTSSGLTAEDHRRLFEWPDGLRLFPHFRDLPGPLRLPDVTAYVQSLGFTLDAMPYKTFQGTPMRYRGVHVGSFFLAEKEGGEEFTSEDEEILGLLASNAATAIANARTHRAEQRARADLEALVETTPVGVVVLNARTGSLVSLNREAKRIVEDLRMPGRTAEQLLEVLTCQRADGRTVSFSEIPVAQELRRGETVRAEEIVLSVPDGRSVTTLVNATPIHSEDGEVVSVVVTMQDLAPLEELERFRAEFLGMVSHELRMPLAAIKGSASTVLDASSALDPAEAREFFRIIGEQADRMRDLISDLLDVGRIETGTLSVSPEPSEVGALVDQARNTFLSGGGRHRVLVDLPLELPRVMADRQRIVQVLNNLLSNAAAYSPVSAPIRVAALRDGEVAISVEDEGRGVPPERLPHLFRKYGGRRHSDRGPETEGSGLGLSICKGLVEAHGGRIWAESDGVSQGTRFTFTIPVAEEAATAAVVSTGRSHSPRERPAEKTRILVVDDDPQMLRYVREALLVAGYAPLVTGDPRGLSDVIRKERPRLVLLDLMLPGTDGIELMELVPELSDQPVIFISGYGRDETIARALEIGAADYIVKPFSPTELTARVRAALRKGDEADPFVLRDLTIHYEQREVTMAGHPVRLTVTEYELLRVLSRNAGRVSTYDMLVRQVWGERATDDTELVRTFIKKLRSKLGDDAARPTYIHTERGVGYRMAKPGACHRS